MTQVALNNWIRSKNLVGWTQLYLNPDISTLSRKSTLHITYTQFYKAWILTYSKMVLFFVCENTEKGKGFGIFFHCYLLWLITRLFSLRKWLKGGLKTFKVLRRRHRDGKGQLFNLISRTLASSSSIVLT